MGVKINIGSLRSFEKPLIANNGLFIEVLQSVKGCQDAAGEGTGIADAFNANGIAMEKAFNGSVVPAAQNVLSTLAASADNAEEVQKVMASFEAVSTSAVAEAEVKKGVRPAAFGR